MKLLVLNNLASGYGEGAIYDFVRSFAADGDEVCLRSTDGTTELESLITDARDFDAVIASGGDGTVTATAYSLAGTGIPVMPFPAGTANLLALNLAAPNEPHALAKMLRAGITLDFDMAEIEFRADDGESAKKGFGIMAGAGYDAMIMKGAQPSKRLLGPMAYFSAALANPLPPTSKITLTLDGETVEEEGLGILIVNFSKIQFDISVTNKNSPRDGLLDIVVLKAENAFGLLPALFARAIDHEGNFKDSPETIETFQAREVVVEADPPMQIQYDGEVAKATTPFAARILPSAARFVVSEECVELFGAEGDAKLAPLDRQGGLGESQVGGGCCRLPTRNLLAGCPLERPCERATSFEPSKKPTGHQGTQLSRIASPSGL